MRRLTRTALLAAGVAIAVSAWPVLAQQPTAPGTRPGRQFNIQEMIDRMAERLGLTQQEKAAVVKAFEAKRAAREALGAELDKLSTVASNDKSTEAQLTKALDTYFGAMKTYYGKVQAADKALSGAVSVRSKARLVAAGIIDNGLGFGGMRRGAGGMMGGPGRPGGAGAPRTSR